MTGIFNPLGAAGPLPEGANAIGTVGVTSLPAIPAGTNLIGSVGVASKPNIGSTGNAWNAAAVAAAGVSATIDTGGLANVAVFGSASAATTIGVNVSADGANWYPSSNSEALSAAGDFYLQFACGARYIQLTSSAAATITATVAAKG